jgi:hypothetical protein
LMETTGTQLNLKTRTRTRLYGKEPRIMNFRESSAGYEGSEYTPDPKRSQHVLNLPQNIENPDNLKELKGIMGNHSWDDFLGVLKDLHKVH